MTSATRYNFHLYANWIPAFAGMTRWRGRVRAIRHRPHRTLLHNIRGHYFGGGLASRYGRPPLILGFSAHTFRSKPAGRPDWNCAVVMPVIPDDDPVPTPTSVPLVVVSQ